MYECSVGNIFHYFKKFGYKTIVMGASFRSVEEILELAGCDRLTIAPTLLEQLRSSTELVEQKLNASESIEKYSGEKIAIDEASFRLQLNDDAMATEKLSEGIRLFSADIVKLEKIISERF